MTNNKVDFAKIVKDNCSGSCNMCGECLIENIPEAIREEVLRVVDEEDNLRLDRLLGRAGRPVYVTDPSWQSVTRGELSLHLLKHYVGPIGAVMEQEQSSQKKALPSVSPREGLPQQRHNLF